MLYVIKGLKHVTYISMPILQVRKQTHYDLCDLFNFLQLSSDTTGTSLVAQTVKRLPTVRETWVWSLGQEDPLEKAMAPHSSTLAWKIPWTEEHDRVQSMGSQRVGHDWAPSFSLSTRLLSLIIISLPEILNCYPWKIAWRYRWVAAKRSVSQRWISFFTVILHRIPEYETDQKACWLESLAAAAQ